MARALTLAVTLDGPALATQIKSAIADIKAERERQVMEEGWTEDHDDAHENGELMAAADCYAPREGHPVHPATPVPATWPWEPSWWKPRDSRRNLIRAGALVLAEAERLGRKLRREQGLSDSDLDALVDSGEDREVADCEARLGEIALRLVDLEDCCSFTPMDEPAQGGL